MATYAAALFGLVTLVYLTIVNGNVASTQSTITELKGSMDEIRDQLQETLNGLNKTLELLEAGVSKKLETINAETREILVLQTEVSKRKLPYLMNLTKETITKLEDVEETLANLSAKIDVLNETTTSTIMNNTLAILTNVTYYAKVLESNLSELIKTETKNATVTLTSELGRLRSYLNESFSHLEVIFNELNYNVNELKNLTLKLQNENKLLIEHVSALSSIKDALNQTLNRLKGEVSKLAKLVKELTSKIDERLSEKTNELKEYVKGQINSSSERITLKIESETGTLRKELESLRLLTTVNLVLTIAALASIIYITFLK